MARKPAEDKEVSPRDYAARAAWMSYVGGLTQDQIAQELGISRQRAQRLVARANAEGLIRVRIEHPVAACLELERALMSQYSLESALVAPGLGLGGDPMAGLAAFAAPALERFLGSEEPLTIALGTGRTLRSVVEQMEAMEATHHKLVALNGNIAPDGTATAYEVIVRMAEKTGAPQYPLAIPVIARNENEFSLYMALPHVKTSRALAASADIAIVGVGQMDASAPLFVDGFISEEELWELQAAGAQGEIAGHIYDAAGKYLDHSVNSRNMGTRVVAGATPAFCIAAGESKTPALAAALSGGLVNRLATDEHTAIRLLS